LPTLALPLAVLLGGCDVAKPNPPAAMGPPVHLLAMYPPDGCGVGPDPDCAPVPINATIKLRFDRFLNTATTNRQAIQVYTGDPKFSPGITFQVDYDPVERVVEFRVPEGQAFKPQTLYQLVLGEAKDEGDLGIRAFDGAPLSDAELPLHTSFFTGTAGVAQPADSVPSCEVIMREVFNGVGGCTGKACHNTGEHSYGGVDLLDAPYALRLDSVAAVQQTAIDRVAHETDLGDDSGGIPAENSPRFGVRMPLIDSSSGGPGNSYLMYKLFLSKENYAACVPFAGSTLCPPDPAPAPTGPHVSVHTDLPLPGGSIVPSDEELVRLREWFVRGEPMPRLQFDRDGNPVERSVPLQALRALSLFIAAGAHCGG